ncbi:hypothetical protein FVR03_15240 [Pontibacter qinzhouensis]|uniref:YceI family protein n=1 Tax=Pontibacter qinzhouensis TaxID=2603253 RepID=A0A5C8JKU3_9BACT|nr:hypothetical protein [Pontibacter qinzhouensis]TXK37483.1 hypothetical protein FVR03_15240 [Pontibacter qinzhouensis]
MLLIPILLAVAALANVVSPPKEEFVVVKGSKITVQAATSLGNINCSYSCNSQQDTLLLNTLLLKKDRLKVTIPVNQFGCGNPLLNRDFQQTLNAKEYPNIRIEVMSLKKVGKEYKGALKFEVGGKTIMMDDVSFNMFSAQGATYMKSNICLNFTEIGLKAPKKLGGLFKVDEELQIIVELQVSNKAAPQFLTESVI